MVKKAKRWEENQPSQEPARPAPKRATVLGTDHAVTLPTAQGTSLQLSYWDLWFLLVAVQMHGGDLDRLASWIKEDRGFYYDRRSVERKRCHIRDLKRRLEEASVTPTDLVRAAGDLAKTEKKRAIKKVSESIHREREFSEPMKNTPRERGLAHALRGYWDKFPVSPKSYARNISAHFRSKTFYTKNATFGIARTLDESVEEAKKLLEAGKAAQAQALLRGLMTVIVELMAKADDSFGSIGMSFKEGFAVYLKIRPDQTGIDEPVFFNDLLNFLIWEDYGLTDKGIEGYFRGLNEPQADLCVEHLRHEIASLREDDLDYQSEEALTFLGQVVAEQERFDEFEDLAKQMGSRAWRRIIRLADIAMKRQKKPLAIKVFEAALKQGGSPGLPHEEVRETQARSLEPRPKEIGCESDANLG